MASTNLTATNGVDGILMFGRYYQSIVAIEPGIVNNGKLLHPEEASFIRGIAACDDPTAVAACRQRLDVGLDYYYDVKHQITSFLRVWDAILDEKRRYDAVGWPKRNRSFMDSFQVCSYLIPQRVSIGFLPPYVDVPQLDMGLDNVPVLSRPTSYHSETSTAVNSPVNWAEYERSIQDGERLLSDEEEYLEVFALSPTASNDSFEDVNVQDGGAEIISISSDDDGSDSDDSDDSDESEKLPFHLEINDRNIPSSSFGEPDPYRSKDLDDALWEKLLSCPPEAQQSHGEEAQCDENVGKRPPVSNWGKPLGLDLEIVTPKKRKSMAAHGSNGYDHDETRCGDKRLRTC
ncbi:hypothetical protein F5Y19DRAFT_446353 [Xylariaceae sp. FL1651]|nr:hypothetical protein F5Y19DRAFT_446353 [Xylariaceae sp. FL1651]